MVVSAVGQMPRSLIEGVGRAAEWRRAQGCARAVSWRVRALGRGARRTEHQRSRAGCPLQAHLVPDAVCIVDAAVCLFVWVGGAASEEDETLAMALAHGYAQQAEPTVQVSHVLAGAEPDEFRRLYHGWTVNRHVADTHTHRLDKLHRRLGLAGRVLRHQAWPGAGPDQRLPKDADEEVLSGGIVVFSTSSGIVRTTRSKCERTRALLEQLGESFLEVRINPAPQPPSPRRP